MPDTPHMPRSCLEWKGCPGATYMGIDGARGGWVVATSQRGVTTLELYQSLSTLPLSTDARALIDMPIGLPSRGKRRCDLLAREALGTRRSTLFPIPCRPAIYAPSYQECCVINEPLQGCRVSKQAWNLAPRIRELDLFVRADPARHDHIAEGHPELAFRALHPASWPLPPKREPEGQALRESIISEALGIQGAEVSRELISRHKGEADMTDAYDALSLCALLVLTHGHVRFVGDESFDDYGAPQRICVGGTPL